MVTLCAADAMHKSAKEALIVDSTVRPFSLPSYIPLGYA
jgi:hypothetical protein